MHILGILLAVVFLFCEIDLLVSHPDDAYDHNGIKEFNKFNWMKTLPDTIPLQELSLMGTHDTMAFYGGYSLQCQETRLLAQLQAGIRVLDIRCRHFKNSFPIHHHKVYQKANFQDVLNIVTSFLTSYPTEVILMRVKEEYTPLENSRSFGATYEEYIGQYLSKFIWNATNNNPLLGEVRGKIVILDGFSNSKNKYGLDWQDFDIQDKYKLTTNWDLYQKWERIKSQLKWANSKKGSNIFINFLSGSVGSFPYFVASGHSSPGNGHPRLSTGRLQFRRSYYCSDVYPDFPRGGCFLRMCSILFEGTNILTADYIIKGYVNFVGIIYADFPGSRLINAVIDLNFK